MSDLQTLFAAIVARPADLEARRAYAAAIRRTDPAHADFIALQLEVRDAARRGAPRPVEAARRARALLVGNEASWAGAIARKVTSFDFYGGLVESVELTPAQLANGDDLATLAPLRHLRTRDLHGHVDALLALPFLSQIVTLDVGQNALDTSEVQKLAAAPNLAQLQVLDLGDNPVGEVALRSLTQLPKLVFVDTQGTNAPLFTRDEPDGPVQVTEVFRTLANELGALAWLEAEEPPSFDAL